MLSFDLVFDHAQAQNHQLMAYPLKASNQPHGKVDSISDFAEHHLSRNVSEKGNRGDVLSMPLWHRLS